MVQTAKGDAIITCGYLGDYLLIIKGLNQYARDFRTVMKICMELSNSFTNMFCHTVKLLSGINQRMPQPGVGSVRIPKVERLDNLH